MFEDQAVKRVQMDLFVRFHLFELAGNAGLVRQGFEHSPLTLIDGDGAIFTGMIDADHFLDAARRATIAGHGRGEGFAPVRLGHDFSPLMPTSVAIIAMAAEIRAL